MRTDVVINMDHSSHGTVVQLRDLNDSVTFHSVDGGPGGLGAVELRYESRHLRTVRLTVNGIHHDQIVPGASADRQWRRVFFNDIQLQAGHQN
ncbi:hypothetical protein RZS08_47940, partial [Arthrospira platensis SPKY1]|nr:hypothetical protein [Arthrospira platensis SPKY1]